MRSLPDALAPLAAYRQFFPYRVEPSKTRPGKTDKFAIHATGGYRVDHTSPANWMDFETAVVRKDALNADGVGFFFTPECGFWFLDVDGAWDGAAWSWQTTSPGALPVG